MICGRWTGLCAAISRRYGQAKVVTGPIPGGYVTPSEFEATLTWANGVKQVVKTTLDDSPFGVVLKRDGQRNGLKFEGTNGWIWVNRDDIAASDDNILYTPLPDNAVRLEVSGDHMGNFFNSVRSRKDPISPVESGHRSAVIGHLIVIALRQGRKFHWDPEKEVFIGDGAKEANTHLAREMRKHLVHYLKGFDGARDLRQKLLTSEDPDWVLESLKKLHATLPETDPPHVELPE